MVEKLPQDKQKFIEQQRRIQPLYVRAMNGVVWHSLKIQRNDEGTNGYTLPDD